MIRNAKVGERVRSGNTGESSSETKGVIDYLWPDGCEFGTVTNILYGKTKIIYVAGDHPKAIGSKPFWPSDLERVRVK